MIQINLLPEEMRRSRPTSARTLALLFVVSVVSFGALGVAGFMYFNLVADREARVAILQEQLDGLTPRAKFADALSKEKAEFDKRNKTIDEIATSRIVWTTKLDRLSEVVNRDATQGRHRVWLTSLDVNGNQESAQSGVKLKGVSAGSDINNYTNFQDDLKQDPVFNQGFAYFTPPSAKQAEPDQDLDPADKNEFQFEIKLPQKDKLKKPVKKAAAPAKTSGP